MIDCTHALPLTRQVELVGISRGAVYYHPEPVSEADQRLMKRIDALNLAHPFMGSRMLRDMLNREGFEVGRRHVATLMQRMGIEALYRKPNTSKKHLTHKIYPYLLRELTIERPNQVWASDITYIPMACGWVYLCAIVDWASRRVLCKRSANPSFVLTMNLRTSCLGNQRARRGEHGSTADGALPGAGGGVSGLGAEGQGMGRGQRRSDARDCELVRPFATLAGAA